MYICPNCAGNLKYDVVRRQLLCEHCGTTADPYEFDEGKAAEENQDEYEVTIFTCPQCGGEILSEDTTAATFCSFCGASTILESRVSKQRRPVHIIPFSRTKEDCKAAYAKMMQRAVFAPDELRNPEHIEKFRGIYMPYWVYSFEKDEKVSFSGSKSHRRGDYVYTNHYQLSGRVAENYKNLTYDASASFADNLSEAIAPFDLQMGTEFAPAFLSGFYADTNDVEQWVYQDEAEELVTNDCKRKLRSDSNYRMYHISDYSLSRAAAPEKRSASLAMFPVWFLAYRNKDRVSYAVINGQTGKAAAEIPVDPKKYLIGSGILSVIIFIILNLFFTFTPMKSLIIAMILAGISMIISNTQLNSLFARESGEEDKGLAAVRARQRRENLADLMADGREQGQERRKKSSTGTIPAAVKTMLELFVVFALVQSVLPLIIRVMMRSAASGGMMTDMIPYLTLLCVMVPVFLIIRKTKNNLNRNASNKQAKPKAGFQKKIHTLWKPMAGIGAAFLILITQPVNDASYYIGIILCLAMVLWSFMDIIAHHNELSTRKLPQFQKRGGDENA